MGFQVVCLRCIRSLSQHHGLVVLFQKMGVVEVIFRFMQQNADDRRGLGSALGALLCLEAMQAPDEGIDFFDDA